MVGGKSHINNQHDILLTDGYSTIPLVTPPYPTLHETTLQSKGPRLPRSVRFRVVGSLGHIYVIG
jgi:hypothetical protein